MKRGTAEKGDGDLLRNWNAKAAERRKRRDRELGVGVAEGRVQEKMANGAAGIGSTDLEAVQATAVHWDLGVQRENCPATAALNRPANLGIGDFQAQGPVSFEYSTATMKGS